MNRLDARALLLSGDADGNRDLLVWAIGAHVIGTHCLSVIQLIDGRYSTDTFGQTGREFRIQGGWHGATFSRFLLDLLDDPEIDDPEIEVARITWPEVAALVTRERVGEDLIAEMADAMRVRRERTRVPDPRRPSNWWQTAEALAERDAWADIERRCDALGEQAWLRCRPADVHEPADLLELLATMGGAA